MFLRLGLCNLTCTWCDTAYTWDDTRFDLDKEIREVTDRELIAQLLISGVDRLVVTGGEPMLQQRKLIGMLQEIKYAIPNIEVETNGTVPVDPHFAEVVSQFNVSPKLAHSGNAVDKAIKPQTLRDLERTGKAFFKFVVGQPSDLAEVDLIVGANRLTNIWLMPEGTTPEAITDRMRWICDAAIERGWSVSSRLHIMAWNDERGR